MSTSTRSIADPWFVFDQPLFFERLGAVARPQRWAILDALRDAEMATIEAADVAEYREQLARGMALAPLLHGTDLDALSTRCVNDVFKRNMHSASMFAELTAGGDIRDLVDPESLCPFEAVRAQTPSVVILPVHAGAIEAGVAALSYFTPMSLVVSQAAQVPEVVDHRYTDLIGPIDLEILRAPSPTVLLKCIKAVRRGRCLAFPPEFTSKDDDSVVAVEVAGRTVGVPDGYVRFAFRLGLPLMVMTFRQTADFGYRFEWEGPFYAEDPATFESGVVPAAVEGVFAVVADILRTRPYEWEGWWMFDRMVADGERIARCPA